jgi:ribosomal protein L2
MMRSVVSTICVLLFLSALVFAHGDEKHVMGTVTKVEDGSIIVKTKEGDKTVMVLSTTKFVKGTATVTQKDVKVGDRVVIHAMPMGDMLHATEVKIGAAPAPQHQH